MRVYETELPGVGVRYVLKFETGGELVVLTRNEGTREIYWRKEQKSDATRLFELNETDARIFSDVLEGTYFQPVDERLEEVFENARIRWVNVAPESDLAGRTIGEFGIRSRTGVTILGIRRGEEIISEVNAETVVEPDDVLVAVGSEDGHDQLNSILR